MSDQLLKDILSGSISDNSLSVIGDPVSGQLKQTSFHAMKDYFVSGVSGSITGSINTGSLLQTASFNAFTSSINSQVSNVYSSQSNYTQTSVFNPYTASVSTQITNVFTSESIFSSSYVVDSSSFNNRIASITGSGGTVNTGSLLPTSSFNTFSASYHTDSASFDLRIGSISGSGAIYSGSLTLQQVTTAGSSSNNQIVIPDLYFNSGSITSSFSLNRAMSNLVGGDDSVTVATAIAQPVISGSTASWRFLTTAQHSAMFFTDITSSSSQLILNYPQAKDVISFFCSTDDSLAPYGIFFGIAGNITNLTIALWAPTNQSIVLTTASSGAWSVADSFGSGTTVVYDTGSGNNAVNSMALPDNIARGLIIPHYVGSNPYIAKIVYNGASVNQCDFVLYNLTNGSIVSGSNLTGTDRVYIGNAHTLYRTLNLTGVTAGSYESKVFAGLANFQALAFLRKA